MLFPMRQEFAFNYLLLMLSYTLEEIPIAMSMAVSLIAVIERDAKSSSLQSQATLLTCDQQTKKSLFTGIIS